jgi:hypothetical protein
MDQGGVVLPGCENKPVTLEDLDNELKPVMESWPHLAAWTKKYILWAGVMGKKKVIAGLAAIIVFLFAVGAFLTVVSTPSPLVYTVLGIAIGACLILILLLA